MTQEADFGRRWAYRAVNADTDEEISTIGLGDDTDARAWLLTLVEDSPGLRARLERHSGGASSWVSLGTAGPTLEPESSKDDQ